MTSRDDGSVTGGNGDFSAGGDSAAEPLCQHRKPDVIREAWLKGES